MLEESVGRRIVEEESGGATNLLAERQIDVEICLFRRLYFFLLF